jgi:hypothetical protein
MRSISHSPEKLWLSEYVDKTGKKVAIKCDLRFIDSYRFMPASLGALLKNLKTHPHLSRFYQGEQLEQLLKKGVYPYEWVDSPERINETQLPLGKHSTLN